MTTVLKARHCSPSSYMFSGTSPALFAQPARKDTRRQLPHSSGSALCFVCVASKHITNFRKCTHMQWTLFLVVEDLDFFLFPRILISLCFRHSYFFSHSRILILVVKDLDFCLFSRILISFCIRGSWFLFVSEGLDFSLYPRILLSFC